MKNKIRSALFLVAMMAFALDAQAVPTTMFGNTDCGKWRSEPSATKKTWLLGYLSGLNAMWGASPKDPLDALSSAEQAFAWMDNYCQKNPLEDVAAGGALLFFELAKKKRESH